MLDRPWTERDEAKHPRGKRGRWRNKGLARPPLEPLLKAAEQSELAQDGGEPTVTRQRELTWQKPLFKGDDDR